MATEEPEESVCLLGSETEVDARMLHAALGSAWNVEQERLVFHNGGAQFSVPVHCPLVQAPEQGLRDYLHSHSVALVVFHMNSLASFGRVGHTWLQVVRESACPAVILLGIHPAATAAAEQCVTEEALETAARMASTELGLRVRTATWRPTEGGLTSVLHALGDELSERRARALVLKRRDRLLGAALAHGQGLQVQTGTAALSSVTGESLTALARLAREAPHLAARVLGCTRQDVVGARLVIRSTHESDCEDWYVAQGCLAAARFVAAQRGDVALLCSLSTPSDLEARGASTRRLADVVARACAGLARVSGPMRIWPLPKDLDGLDAAIAKTVNNNHFGGSLLAGDEQQAYARLLDELTAYHADERQPCATLVARVLAPDSGVATTQAQASAAKSCSVQ